ncbi:MAG: 1-acyl-sn-glycerol-3-phosphate acyltransferase [Chlorobi bacterium]|nr:1-acyl-sn-glycerol-3-phosphate acyltransferase [Chlorobiota bacterium]
MKGKNDRPDHLDSSILRGVFRLLALLIASLLWLPFSAILIFFASLFDQRTRFRLITTLTSPFCRTMAAVAGLHVRREGKRDPDVLIYVTNHVSWLDILTAGIAVSGVFVSRHDVKNWPGIGLFARLAGTVFIDRSSLRSAISSSNNIIERTEEGIRVLFFPEGRATSGDQVEPFKAFLFGGITEKRLAVQPLTILYTHIGRHPITPENKDQVYWYRTDQNFLSHAWQILKAPNLKATVLFHKSEAPPINPDREGLREFAERLRQKTAQGVPVWGSTVE